MIITCKKLMSLTFLICTKAASLAAMITVHVVPDRWRLCQLVWHTIQCMQWIKNLDSTVYLRCLSFNLSFRSPQRRRRRTVSRINSTAMQLGQTSVFFFKLKCKRLPSSKKHVRTIMNTGGITKLKLQVTISICFFGGYRHSRTITEYIISKLVTMSKTYRSLHLHVLNCLQTTSYDNLHTVENMKIHKTFTQL